MVPMMAITAFVAGTAAGLVLYLGAGKEPLSLPIFRNKFYLDEIYGAIVAGTQDVLAFVANGVDTVISGIVRLIGMTAWAGGFALRYS